MTGWDMGFRVRDGNSGDRWVGWLERGFVGSNQPSIQPTNSLERSAGAATLVLRLRLQRVGRRAARCGRAGAGLRRADHDARAVLEIAGLDLRLLAIGDAELHEVRRQDTIRVDRPEARHAAGLRARRTRTA